MHIRAPKSGYMRVHVSRPDVLKGDLLFSLEASEEDIELMKAELALALVRASAGKLQAAKTNDRIQRTLDTYRNRSASNLRAHQLLLKRREDQLANGEITDVTLAQADALHSAARRDLALAGLSYQSLLSSLSDLEQVLPLQEAYGRLAVEAAKDNVARTSVNSPLTGRLIDWQVSDGWTSRGAIIASFEA